MKLNHIYNEPCLDTIKRFDPNSIDCVITSPPYWQLRDYGYSGQWGLEPTFNEYLEHLWQMMDGIYKALKPSGTVWINLGDTYGTQSGGMALAQDNFESKESKYGAFENPIKQPKTIHKCLLLLPHRFAIGCIERGWIIRNDIVWAKRNGMPESVTDRFSKKHEYFFFMTKSTDYYFDLDAIRDKHQTAGKLRNKSIEPFAKKALGGIGDGSRNWWSENGKNPGSISDFWDIPTKPSTKEHYAQYNDELLKKPVLAGCPKEGIIYDPFMGSGTTGLMALRTGRKFIGSEMSIDYLKIANKHIDAVLQQTNLF